MPNQQKPLEGRDARIAAAQSWARSFSYECEGALEGKPHQMSRAAAQLVAAIEQIDGKDDDYCQCGHNYFAHFGERGIRPCLAGGDCTCVNFVSAIPVTK